VVRAAGIAAVEVAEARSEDLLLDVLGLAGMDGLAQLLDEELQELGAGALEGLAKRFRGDGGEVCRPELLASSSIAALGASGGAGARCGSGSWAC